MVLDAEICVVGAGIVGLAHGLEARRRGLRVVVLERSEYAVGASVRNFGHCFISGMADGAALDCALDSRERWRELGPAAGLDVLECGSLVVARHPDELAALAELAADPRRHARLLSPREVGALVPIPTAGLLGGLFCELDLRVDPRSAVARLAALLARDPEAKVLWGAHVHTVAPGTVEATRAGASVTVRAAATVVCPGPDYAALAPQLRPARSGLTLCRLQMLRVAAPTARTYEPALLTGLSVLRYPGFARGAAHARVRARLAAERPELLAAGIHLIVTQLPGGDLILGDTHAYADTVAPFSDERLDQLVLAEARRLLGTERLAVRERWHGVYPSAPGDPFLIAAPMPGVRVVEVVAGVGMTTGLGLAARTLDELSPPRGRRPTTPPRSAAARAGCGP